MAADPEDARLQAALAARDQRHAEYLEELEAAGLRVATADEGFVIRAATGEAFHPGYVLLGAYDADGQSVWSSREAARLRAELDRRMGLALVTHGPHDAWDVRPGLDRANPLWAPPVPALLFQPTGHVPVVFEVAELASKLKYRNVAWDASYGESTA